MLVNALLQYEVEGWVDRLVEEAGGLENKRAELVEELAIKVAEVITSAIKGSMEAKTTTPLTTTCRKMIGNGRNGCSYKKFVACKPKEFDGKGGAVAYIRWVEKMEAV
ncbi:hypothetical protein Tco_0837207 [Tanacetum coccineum]